MFDICMDFNLYFKNFNRIVLNKIAIKYKFSFTKIFFYYDRFPNARMLSGQYAFSMVVNKMIFGT